MGAGKVWSKRWVPCELKESSASFYDNGTGHRKTAVQGMADDNGDNP